MANKWFIDRGQARFCSRKCWARWQTGKNNPAWTNGIYSNGSIEVECEWCHKRFMTFLSRIKRGMARFCSRKCKGKFQTLQKGSSVICVGCGERFWKQNSRKSDSDFCSHRCYLDNRPQPIEKRCEYCDNPFMVYNAKASRRGGRYCSKKCMGKAWTGENSPSWKGGCKNPGRNKLTPGNRRWRKSVFDRDEHECQKCGKVINLHAHHIFQYKRYPKYRLVVQNGITLCDECHDLFHELYGRYDFRPEDTFEFLGSDYDLESHGDLLLEGRGHA